MKSSESLNSIRGRALQSGPQPGLSCEFRMGEGSRPNIARLCSGKFDLVVGPAGARLIRDMFRGGKRERHGPPDWCGSDMWATRNFGLSVFICESGGHLAGVFEIPVERGGSLFMHVFVTFVIVVKGEIDAIGG